MSLSAPRLTNPCKVFIEFKGDRGVFRYWDKEANKTSAEKGGHVELNTPIQFIVLDELCCIKGFCEDMKSAIYSNEVKNLTDKVLNVRTFKGGLKVVGLYADIKGDIKSAGGKFCKSVYAALIHGDDVELVNFQLTGIAFSSWLNKEIDLSLSGVSVSRCEDGKKGSVKYKIPIYEKLDIPRDLMEKAVAMDKKLQEYLASYQKVNEVEVAKTSVPAPDLENDDIPF